MLSTGGGGGGLSTVGYHQCRAGDTTSTAGNIMIYVEDIMSIVGLFSTVKVFK